MAIFYGSIIVGIQRFGVIVVDFQLEFIDGCFTRRLYDRPLPLFGQKVGRSTFLTGRELKRGRAAGTMISRFQEDLPECPGGVVGF